MALPCPPKSVLFALGLALVWASGAPAAERTFIFAPADLVGVIDDFNAEVLGRSASLGRAVSVRGGIVRLAGKGCPSLAVDPLRRLTRVRVLDSAERAALLAGRRKSLAAALTTLGAATWQPPTNGSIARLSWFVEPVVPGVLGFAAMGYPNGDGTGALDLSARGDSAASLRVDVDLDSSTPDPAGLVLAVTTELPPRRPGGRWKRATCYALAHCEAADIQALVDLVAAAPLVNTTRNKLNDSLDDALYWVAHNNASRAARKVKVFAIAVASRSASEIPPEHAEEMITRALSVIEALGL